MKMFINYFKFSLLTTWVIGSITFGEVSYSIDPENSSMYWVGKKIGGQHNGTVNLHKGEITQNGKEFAGQIVIDMTSIVNSDIKNPLFNRKLVNHLKSEDFFSVAKHPTAVLDIIQGFPFPGSNKNKTNYRIKGKLTIKGITREITFPAWIDFNENGFTAKANFEIDRTRWHVRYGSGSFFSNLGDKAIGDKIGFEINLVSKRISKTEAIKS